MEFNHVYYNWCVQFARDLQTVNNKTFDVIFYM